MMVTFPTVRRPRPLAVALLCILVLSKVCEALDSPRLMHRRHSAGARLFRTLPSFSIKHEMQSCAGLAVASAYYKIVNATVHVEMATAFQAWTNYTPFAEASVRCVIEASMGSFLVTRKHHTHCRVPLANVSSASLETGNLTMRIIGNSGDACELNLHHLKQDPRSIARYAVSALTTVQNSETYFREWVNYLFCTGWSHTYVYDDASGSPMKQLLSSLSRTGFITYADWSHAHEHRSRQFMAMQDFLIRFRHETKVVAQMDDDCYYLATNTNGQLVTDVASTIQQFFDRPGSEEICQLRSGSYWFGHGWVRQRTKPLALSSMMRANVSLSSTRFEWSGARGEKSRQVDSTLSVAKTDKIQGASGITHAWDMASCRTDPPSPPTSLYFNHYKVKPWDEKKADAKASGSWGQFNKDEPFWESTAGVLHHVNDTTMDRLDAMLGLSVALGSQEFPPVCKLSSRL